MDGEIAQSMDISTESGTTLSVSNNLFHGNVNNDFKTLDNNPQNGNPLFSDLTDLDKESFKILSDSPVVNKGIMFSEPVFPMAGTGIFKHISATASTDTFSNQVDLKQFTPKHWCQ